MIRTVYFLLRLYSFSYTLDYAEKKEKFDEEVLQESEFI